MRARARAAPLCRWLRLGRRSTRHCGARPTLTSPHGIRTCPSCEGDVPVRPPALPASSFTAPARVAVRRGERTRRRVHAADLRASRRARRRSAVVSGHGAPPGDRSFSSELVRLSRARPARHATARRSPPPLARRGSAGPPSRRPPRRARRRLSPRASLVRRDERAEVLDHVECLLLRLDLGRGRGRRSIVRDGGDGEGEDARR